MAKQLEIEVNIDVINEKIKELNTLITSIEEPKEKEVLGKGKAKEQMEYINMTSTDLMVSLISLISATVTFLEDTKDKFIEVDESLAEELLE